MASFMGPPQDQTSKNYKPPPNPPPSHQSSSIDPHLPAYANSPRPSLFPLSFPIYLSDTSTLFKTSETLLIGPSKQTPLFTATLGKDKLQRPSMILRSSNSTTDTPLASVKSKGLKDAIIIVEGIGMAASSSEDDNNRIEEKLTTRYGVSSRTYVFAMSVKSRGTTTRESFAWKRAGTHGKSAMDQLGLDMDMDMDLNNSSSNDYGLSELQTKRELIRESTGDLLASWTENDGSSMSEIGRFEFLGNSGVESLGPQWQIMALMSVLRIWHEDYYVAKKVIKAVAGG